MGRSFRKLPIFGITTVRSEKKDKRLANRAYRRSTRETAFESVLDGWPFCWLCGGTGDNPEAAGGCPRCPWPISPEIVFESVDAPPLRELTNAIAFGKDGKKYWAKAEVDDMRK